MTDRDILVLIVDDDDTLREELREALESCDLRVVDASNGLKAIALLDEVKPDLVITDIHMPEMDGIEIVLRLRQCLPDVPIIAISGGDAWGFMGNLRSAGRLGAVRALEKPFDLATLVRTAFELLGEDSAA